METGSTSVLRVLRFAGAFCAWVIGSGFATGQEILQFVTSYGYQSYLVLLVLAAGFSIMGFTITGTAYEHRHDQGPNGAGFRHFNYFCGNRLGNIYNWMVPVVQIVPLAVLLSGAGATLSEYYGLDHTLGVFIMAAAVLLTYYAGFERLTNVVAFIGPLIILFTLFVGAMTIVRDIGNFGEAGQYQELLAAKQNVPHWFESALLYVSLNFVCGSVYYTELGGSAHSRREVRLGTALGVAALLAIVTISSTAILLNAGDAAALEIPTLFLAQKISPVLGALFSVVLALGIYSSSATGLYVVIKTLSGNIPLIARHDKLAALGIDIIAFLIGVFSFGNLIGFFYPILGCAGIIFTACVFWRCLRRVEQN